MDLQQLKQSNPGSEEIARCVEELCEQTSSISEDVHDLSHELYSSKLKILGPIAAMRGFCRELAAKQKVEIEFHHDDILRSIPTEVSLCLFRILQEALHNAVKHSGVRHFKVEFREVDNTITPRRSRFRTGLRYGGGDARPWNRFNQYARTSEAGEWRTFDRV